MDVVTKPYSYGDCRYYYRKDAGEFCWIVEKWGRLSNGVDTWMYYSSARDKTQAILSITNLFESMEPDGVMYMRAEDYRR